MQTEWFRSTLQYDKMLENGCAKRVTEEYLVNAITVGDAERTLTMHMKQYISGDFFVKKCAKQDFAEVLFGEGLGDYFWEAKLAFITLDEKSREEKLTFRKCLIQADNLTGALNATKKMMEGCCLNYVFETITRSKICDVFSDQTEFDFNNDDNDNGI